MKGATADLQKPVGSSMARREGFEPPTLRSKRDPNRDFIEEIRFLAKIRVNPDRFPDPR